jgi:hypothetical protein
MAAERPTPRSTGKPGRKRDRSGKPAPETTSAAPQSRYVDFDPWAMLAELMVTPEEEPTEHTGPKKK